MNALEVLTTLVNAAEKNRLPDHAEFERQVEPIEALDEILRNGLARTTRTSALTPTVDGLCAANEQYRNTIPDVVKWLDRSHRESPNRLITVRKPDGSVAEDISVYANAGLRGPLTATLWALSEHEPQMVIPETERDERGGIRMTGFRISSSILRAPKDIEKLLKKKQAKASAFEEPDTSNEESPPPAIRPYDFSFLEHGSELSKAQPRGKWRLLKKLGEGGGGIVHLASDRSILDPFIELEVNIPKAVNIGVMQYGDQKFKDSKQLLRIISRMLFPPPGALGALKEPLLERITDKSARERAEERFRREIEVLALPEKHPHLIKMLDHDPGMRWFVMELFEEGTLHENAAAFRGRLRKTLTAILGIVGVLDMLHKRNVIHRDIKPKNIFTSNRTRELVLADFGVVWRRDDDLTRLTEGSEAPGSANWMPNWIKHKQATLEDFTPSCDLYSLGKTIYYCIAGRNVEPSQLPRDDSDLTKLFPGLPGMSPLMEFLKGRVIVDEESACIQSAGEFRTALIEILSATT